MPRPDSVNPLTLQRSILETVSEQSSGQIADADLAELLATDVDTVRIHLEILAAEDRINVDRDEAGFSAVMSERHRELHQAPPPHVVTRQRMEQAGRTLEELQIQINRVLSWSPLAFTVVGGVVGWFAGEGALRGQYVFYSALFGLIMGMIVRKELIR